MIKVGDITVSVKMRLTEKRPSCYDSDNESVEGCGVGEELVVVVVVGGCSWHRFTPRIQMASFLSEPQPHNVHLEG